MLNLTLRARQSGSQSHFTQPHFTGRDLRDLLTALPLPSTWCWELGELGFREGICKLLRHQDTKLACSSTPTSVLRVSVGHRPNAQGQRAEPSGEAVLSPEGEGQGDMGSFLLETLLRPLNAAQLVTWGQKFPRGWRGLTRDLGSQTPTRGLLPLCGPDSTDLNLNGGVAFPCL